MKDFLKQLLLFILISCFITAAFVNIGVNIFISIILSIVIQYALYNAFVYGLDAFALIRVRKLEVERLKQLSYQGMEVVCPCSQQAKEFVPIRLNRPNYYKCKTCKRTVGVFTGVETALVTEPIADTNLSSVEQLLQEKLNEHSRKH